MKTARKPAVKLYSDFSDIDSGHEDDFDGADIYKRQLAYPPFPIYDVPDFKLSPTDYKLAKNDFKTRNSAPDVDEFDLRIAATDFKRNSSDFRIPLSDFQQRSPPQDFIGSPPDFNYRNGPPAGAPPSQDFRNLPNDFQRSPPDDFRNGSNDFNNKIPPSDFNNKRNAVVPNNDSNKRSPPNEFNKRGPPPSDKRSPSHQQDYRIPPQDFNRSLPQDFRSPPSDFKRSPPQDFRSPPSDFNKRSPPQDFRGGGPMPPTDFKRSPPQEYRNGPPPADYTNKRSPSQDFPYSLSGSDFSTGGGAPQDFRLSSDFTLSPSSTTDFKLSANDFNKRVTFDLKSSDNEHTSENSEATTVISSSNNNGALSDLQKLHLKQQQQLQQLQFQQHLVQQQQHIEHFQRQLEMSPGDNTELSDEEEDEEDAGDFSENTERSDMEETGGMVSHPPLAPPPPAHDITRISEIDEEDEEEEVEIKQETVNGGEATTTAKEAGGANEVVEADEEDEEEEDDDDDDEEEEEEEDSEGDSETEETEESSKQTTTTATDEIDTEDAKRAAAEEELKRLDEARKKLEEQFKAEEVDPNFSAEHDMDFAVVLDDMINKLHQTKLLVSDKTEIANKLSEYVTRIGPTTLMKNLSQLIPLITSIASENNFHTSLSILNTINLLSQRFKELDEPRCDLTWLIRRLCTFASESRSTLRTEGFIVLKNVISNFGSDYVLQPFLYILSDFGVKGGGRVKSIAVDAITYCVIIFPRDSFDFSMISEWACRMLWNSKRRVRQAALELISMIVQVMGTSPALSLFRQYIERPMNSSTTSSSETLAEMNPMNAINARISRHLLPTLSHTGLIDYGLVIPFNSVVKKAGEEEQLHPVRSGGKIQTRTSGADVEWVLKGRGPLVRSSSDHHNSMPGGDKDEEPNLGEIDKGNHVYSSSSASSSSSQTRNPLPQLYTANDFKNFEPSAFHQTYQVYRMEGFYNKWEQPPTPPQTQLPEAPLFSKNWKSSLDIATGSSDEFGAYPPESDFLYRKPVLARQPKPKAYDLQLQDVEVPEDKLVEEFKDVKITDRFIPTQPKNKITARRPKKPPPRREVIAARKKQPAETNTLQKCLTKLTATDWLINLDGFTNLTKLIQDNTEEHKHDTPTINKHALKHLTNLRSQVCRAACVFFKEMFVIYGKHMETDCEKIIEKLLDKTCDVNKFIREDASTAVMAALESVSYTKIFACFESFGVKHRNPVVRATTAKMIFILVCKHGNERSLDMSEKLLPVLIKLLQEGSLETRTHAKETIAQLMTDDKFDERLKRYVPPEQLRAVTKNINAIRNRL